MFGRKWRSLEEGTGIADPQQDYRTAKRIGQFKLSENAIYKPDGTYLPLNIIKEITHDRTAVHVSGCCAGGVMVERLIFHTAAGKYPFLF
ncbi:MAG: hypothetical protein KBT01_04195, partial [Clostridiales bacterium]|nr:hypothetical protein [Candidatus Blautia equi]